MKKFIVIILALIMLASCAGMRKSTIEDDMDDAVDVGASANSYTENTTPHLTEDYLLGINDYNGESVAWSVNRFDLANLQALFQQAPSTIGSGTPNSGVFTTLDTTGAFTSLGIDDNADATAITIAVTTENVTLSSVTEASAIGTAALTSAGGIGVAFDAWIGDDIVLDSDGAIISFGADQDINITHTADTGLTVFEGTEEILILADGGAGSSVNEITILSTATTVPPVIRQTGEDDIGIDFETVNAEELLQLDAIAAGTNNLVIGNNADGSSPTIVAVGSSDANVGISIDAKAAGEIAIGSADAKFSVTSDALDITNAGAISGATSITASGIITGLVNTATDVTTVTNFNGTFAISDAAKIAFTLPTAAAGYSICLYQGKGRTDALSVTAASGDYIVYNGVAGTVEAGGAESEFHSAGAATDRICLISMNADDWYVSSSVGTWTE